MNGSAKFAVPTWTEMLQLPHDERMARLRDPEARAVLRTAVESVNVERRGHDVEQRQLPGRDLMLDGDERHEAHAEADHAATVSHEAVKGRTLYLKKVGDRWFLENRTSDEKKDP